MLTWTVTASGDGTVKLSFTQLDPNALQSVALMYQVVLDRAADAGGLAFWLGSGDSSTHMASMFVESAEFSRHFGKLDDAHFVATLLANSGVASTGVGAAGWETWLATHSRAELVVALIGDPAVTNAQFGAQGLWLVQQGRLATCRRGGETGPCATAPGRRTPRYPSPPGWRRRRTGSRAPGRTSRRSARIRIRPVRSRRR
ncbi:MAG: hypothetical protein JWR65_41 [Massilia sp.]|nr:hypothetical protein [Massilia sp.]